jgi:hypothetical protein
MADIDGGYRWRISMADKEEVAFGGLHRAHTAMLAMPARVGVTVDTGGEFEKEAGSEPGV